MDGAQPGRGGDEGFTLVEVIVAIVLMALVAVTSAGFFLRGDATSTNLQRRQAAVAVADQAMEGLRALPAVAATPGKSALLAGRSAAAVNAHWAAAPAAVQSAQLSTMTAAFDPAPTTSTPAVPYTETATSAGSSTRSTGTSAPACGRVRREAPAPPPGPVPPCTARSSW